MSEDSGAAKIELKVEDGVVILAGSVDVIEILEDMAKKSSNTIDDALILMVKNARNNLDWKGIAKEAL